MLTELLTTILRRIVSGPITVGIVTFVLVLSLAACDSVDKPLPLLTETTEPQQLSAPTSILIPTLAPTVVNVEPATPSAVPTTPVEAEQEPSISSADPTTLVEAAQVPPTATLVPTIPPSHTLLPSSTPTPLPTSTASTVLPTATSEAAEEIPFDNPYPIGLSFNGLPLTAYQFNNGPHHVIVVGGIHGGYEWNTILLAYEMIKYFQENPAEVPDSVTLTIIPVANPDGLERVSGKIGPFSDTDLDQDTRPGRFNGNEVDLNRNWDCMWQPKGIWRGREVSAGETEFSEPETKILKDFFFQHRPDAVIFLHSALGGVFASGCPDTHQPSMDLAWTYGVAADYPVYERFSAYEVTGDAGDWLTTQGITSISVELINHQDLDLEKNMAGILAVLERVK